MNGNRLTCLILAINLAAAICFACDRNWPKALYFAGASILTVGVLLMN